MRILGIDYGSARIGLALGDDITRIASPWEQLTNTHDELVFEQISNVCKNELVERVVVGVPHMLADRSQETQQQQEIRGFISALRQRGFQVVEQDETWSTLTAARQQQERGQKGKRDDLAAAVILQSYLDRLPYGTLST